MKLILATLTLSILLTTNGIALAAIAAKPADADNFYKSYKVSVQKVTFANQYRMIPWNKMKKSFNEHLK